MTTSNKQALHWAQCYDSPMGGDFWTDREIARAAREQKRAREQNAKEARTNHKRLRARMAANGGQSPRNSGE